MDAWWPRLVRAEFAPALGKVALARLEAMIDLGTHVGGDSFFGGFWARRGELGDGT